MQSEINMELRFVIALYSEALSIIEYYNLKLVDYSMYNNKIYKNEKNTIWLIQSGIGNKKAENAVNFLHKISNPTYNSLWVNIGIAGHKIFNLGRLYEIKKVTYINDNKNSYYSNSLINCFEMHEVCSVDIPQTVFKDNYIYDMESYGFIQSVEKFCLRENICILKIISDNSNEKPNNYKEFAYKNIKKNMEAINSGLMHYLEEIKKNYIDFSSYMKLLNRKYHITFYNEKKIQNLMPKLITIMENDLIKKEIECSKSLTGLINFFEEKLKNYVLKI